jgi:hypothetical protein
VNRQWFAKILTAREINSLHTFLSSTVSHPCLATTSNPPEKAMVPLACHA